MKSFDYIIDAINGLYHEENSKEYDSMVDTIRDMIEILLCDEEEFDRVFLLNWLDIHYDFCAETPKAREFNRAIDDIYNILVRC